MDKHGILNVSETDNNTLLVQNPSFSDREVRAPEGPYLTINGAWNLKAYPTLIITEMVDNSLKMFNIMPFRKITERDLRSYKGYHPRKCKGNPLPDYLYRFYGLARNEETLSEVIRVRVSPKEKESLEAAAVNSDKTVSEFLRQIIRGL